MVGGTFTVLYWYRTSVPVVAVSRLGSQATFL